MKQLGLECCQCCCIRVLNHSIQTTPECGGVPGKYHTGAGTSGNSVCTGVLGTAIRLVYRSAGALADKLRHSYKPASPCTACRCD